MPKKKDEPKLWKGVCCSRCYTAKSEKKKCKCRCRGNHHGEAYEKKGDEKKPYMSEKAARLAHTPIVEEKQ